MISSFDNPLEMMLDQSMWAFLNSILYQDSFDGERFRELYEFWEEQIKEYLKVNPAPWQ